MADVSNDLLDLRVREAAFRFLEEQVRVHGDVLPASVLREGFAFGTTKVKLQGPQGIFKPQILPVLPLTITTAPPVANQPPPYDDSFTAEGLLLYRYRGKNPMHHENVGLRTLMQRGIPLIYFHGIVKGQYFAAWPVYIVGDEPARLCFRVAADDAQLSLPDEPRVADGDTDARRRYITTTTRRRLHQREFRERVLAAYRERCALCRLRHRDLLDAAHILPDTHPRGTPTVRNGLALCKLHHAAFDQNLIGVRPDYVVQVRPEILLERDGPMLVHGLQGFHERKIWIPRNPDLQPSPELLEERYQAFEARS